MVVAFSLPPPHAGPLVEQLRPREAEQQDRRAAREVGDVVDQVEERRLAPVDVVEDDDERPLAGGVLEQRADRARSSSFGVAAPSAISSTTRVARRAASAPRSTGQYVMPSP